MQITGSYFTGLLLWRCSFFYIVISLWQIFNWFYMYIALDCCWIMCNMSGHYFRTRRRSTVLFLIARCTIYPCPMLFYVIISCYSNVKNVSINICYIEQDLFSGCTILAVPVIRSWRLLQRLVSFIALNVNHSKLLCQRYVCSVLV